MALIIKYQNNLKIYYQINPDRFIILLIIFYYKLLNDTKYKV